MSGTMRGGGRTPLMVGKADSSVFVDPVVVEVVGDDVCVESLVESLVVVVASDVVVASSDSLVLSSACAAVCMARRSSMRPMTSRRCRRIGRPREYIIVMDHQNRGRLSARQILDKKSPVVGCEARRTSVPSEERQRCRQGCQTCYTELEVLLLLLLLMRCLCFC